MKKIEKTAGVTVGELIRHLEGHYKNKEIYMNGLQFSRLKDRGPYVQLEFAEMVREDEDGNLIFREP